MGDKAVEAGGWVGPDPDRLRFLLGADPPRPGAVRRQLRYDLTAPLPWVFVGFGVCILTVGAVSRNWPWVGLGAVWLAGYGIMFRAAARGLRDGRLMRGHVQAIRPVGLAPRLAKAEARLSGGTVVWVTLPTQPAAELIERHGRAEVLILSSPAGGTCSVVGVRPTGDTPWSEAES